MQEDSLNFFQYMMRKQRLTRDKLAAKLGVPKGLVKRWEEGSFRPQSDEQMSALVAALGCTESDLNDYFDGVPGEYARVDRRFKDARGERISSNEERTPRINHDLYNAKPSIIPPKRKNKKADDKAPPKVLSPEITRKYADLLSFKAVGSGDSDE